MLRWIVRAVACVPAAGLLLAASAFVDRAAASTFCVSCTGPDRVYLCDVRSSSREPAPASVQYYCMSRIARDGGHRFCGASRAAADACPGAERSYVFDADTVAPALDSARGQDVDGRAPPQEALGGGMDDVPPRRQGEPETLVDMTARALERGPGERVGGAARATGRAVGGAARTTTRALGSAARTTVNCMRSLFRDCRPDNER